MKTTIGGERLGSGNKQEYMANHYMRSTHDQSYIMRTTVAPGTLVPFMTEYGLPGTEMEITLDAHVLTSPTIGPLFGSMKLQLDVFQAPIRLYHKELMYNKTQIGLAMEKIYLPQVRVEGGKIDQQKPVDNQQINPSSLLAYLDILGIGNGVNENSIARRDFNAIPILAYWDIYKNYYSNKQEKVGYVIHSELADLNATVTTCKLFELQGGTTFSLVDTGGTWTEINFTQETYLQVATTATEPFDIDRLTVNTKLGDTERIRKLTELFTEFTWVGGTLYATNPKRADWWGTMKNYYFDTTFSTNVEPKLTEFPLSNIDEMHELILEQAAAIPLIIQDTTIAPYGLMLQKVLTDDGNRYSITAKQEGLGIKTYQSDLFNNWLDTEWLDGTNGINEITKVNIEDDKFEIQELILKNKIFDMLNMIQLSGGTYDDFIEAVYDEKPNRKVTSPIYEGGLSKEIVFQSVISQSATENEPLGTLAGRGVLGDKHKGGRITVRNEKEASVIMGLASITPRIDYSQGNGWATNLKTVNDFHKPSLDAIGFQELITDQMAWWDTELTYPIPTGVGVPTFKSAGKQPAWTNYTTNVNKIRGNFAIQSDSGWMVLNRKYEPTSNYDIADLTTYIDPKKHNNIFAETRRDAMNFWLQISVNLESRRKMSARQIPNL